MALWPNCTVGATEISRRDESQIGATKISCLLIVLRELFLMIQRIILILARELPDHEPLNRFLPGVFVVGRIALIADLSLRRARYGEVIDRCLSEALNGLRTEIDERFGRELTRSAGRFARAVESVFETKSEEKTT